MAATWARFAAVQRAAEQPSRSPVRIAGRLVHALARAEALSAGRRGATDSSGPESGRALTHKEAVDMVRDWIYGL